MLVSLGILYQVRMWHVNMILCKRISWIRQFCKMTTSTLTFLIKSSVDLFDFSLMFWPYARRNYLYMEQYCDISIFRLIIQISI